jgi:hypothetical protein
VEDNVKKWLAVAALVLGMFTGVGKAQSIAFWTDRAVGVFPFGGGGVTGLVPIQYGPVRVCSIPASGSPCTPVASITDINGVPLTIQGGNFGQLTTDVVGRFAFGCTPGNYLVQVAAASSNTPQLSYPVTCPSGSSLLSTNNIFTGTNTFSGDTIFGGPNPYYDIRKFGAVCDDSTDDTAAINAAITAAAVSGGAVLIPGSCVVAGQLTAGLQSTNVALIGVSSGMYYSDPTRGRARLTFTGSTSPLIDFRSSIGVKIKDLEIRYTNGAFAGTVISFIHSIAQDSQRILIDNVLITGVSGSAISATTAIDFHNTDNIEVNEFSCHWMVNCINNTSTNISHIHDSNFGSQAGDVTGSYIQGSGFGTTIGPANNFELSPVGVTVLDCTTPNVCAQGVNIFGNTLEDAVAGYNGTVFKNFGSGGQGQFSITNNVLLGGTSALGTLVGFTGSPEQVSFTGNYVSNWATVFNGNCCTVEMTISGNEYTGTITTFFNGSPRNGSGRAIIEDNAGNFFVYGLLNLPGATSGTVKLVVPAVAGANTLTLPALTDTLAVLGTFAAPPSIGNTAPAPGAFTTLSSTGNFTPSQTNGIVGTTTNNNANAGSIGELVTSVIATGSSVTLATGVTSNITSVSLTAGDWDCSGAVDFTFGATTSYTNLIGSISTTTGTIGGQDSKFDFETPASVPTAGADATFTLPIVRQLLSGTTTVFLVAQGTFTVSTLKAYGTIRCRRVR